MVLPLWASLTLLALEVLFFLWLFNERKIGELKKKWKLFLER